VYRLIFVKSVPFVCCYPGFQYTLATLLGLHPSHISKLDASSGGVRLGGALYGNPQGYVFMVPSGYQIVLALVCH